MPNKIKFYSLAFSIPLIWLSIGLSVNNLAKKGKTIYKNNFLLEEWNGKIEKKFIDWSNDKRKTIKVFDGIDTILIQDEILFDNDNFDKIEEGDSVSKKRGQTFVLVYRKDHELKFTIDFD